MKCVSCETEINPKWSHAININVCPFCGKHIMEEHLKNCIASLAAAMDEMQKYPEQLDDWLLSNHNYIKTNSPDLTAYVPKETIKGMRKEIEEEEFHEKKMTTMKIKNARGEEEEIRVEVQKVQSDDRTKEFFDRADGVINKGNKNSGRTLGPQQESAVPKGIVEKTKYFKEAVQKIKKESSEGMIGEDGMTTIMMNPSMMERANPSQVAELESAISTDDIIMSGLPTNSTGEDDEIPSVVMNMARGAAAKQGNGNTVNEKDLRTLQEMQYKAATASKRLASGKGGFSRS